MTEVEFAHQLSDLVNTAQRLNAESDSVNDLIRRFEQTLCRINVGLDVWPVALQSERWVEEEDDWSKPRGTRDTELGFAKVDDAWRFATRKVRYDTSSGSATPHIPRLHAVDEVRSLLDAPRETRIAALAHFPDIVTALKQEADSALEKIEAARAFVVGGQQVTKSK